MPLLNQPMELRPTASPARRVLRTALLSLLATAIFVLALAVVVVVTTN